MQFWIKIRFKSQIVIIKAAITNPDNNQYTIKFCSMTVYLGNHFPSFLIKFNLKQQIYDISHMLWWKEKWKKKLRNMYCELVGYL